MQISQKAVSMVNYGMQKCFLMKEQEQFQHFLCRIFRDQTAVCAATAGMSGETDEKDETETSEDVAQANADEEQLPITNENTESEEREHGKID